MPDLDHRVGLKLEPVLVPDGTTFRLTHTPLDIAPSAPVVLCIPAMGVAARYYDPVLRALWAVGLNAAAFDLRGNGESSVRASRAADFGYEEIVTRDIRCAVREVTQLFPNSPVFVLGHSLGGQMACLFSAAAGVGIAGVILIASGSVYFRNWSFPLNLLVLLGTMAARLIASLLGYFPGRLLGFGGREARGVIRDWSAQARTGRYVVSGSSVDFEASLATMDKAVLAITIDDDWLAPQAAARHLCSKMTRARMDYRSVSALEVGGPARVHFRWTRRPQSIVALVSSWLDERKSTS